jgi:hypothetical protein
MLYKCLSNDFVYHFGKFFSVKINVCSHDCSFCCFLLFFHLLAQPQRCLVVPHSCFINASGMILSTTLESFFQRRKLMSLHTIVHFAISFYFSTYWHSRTSKMPRILLLSSYSLPWKPKNRNFCTSSGKEYYLV